MINTTRLSAVTVGTLVCATTWAQRSADYLNPNLPVEQRVDDLLGRMTVEEKIAQIVAIADKASLSDERGRFSARSAAEVIPLGIGQIGRPSSSRGPRTPDPELSLGIRETVDFVNAAQAFAKASTRLGIPILFHEEGLHGHMARDATSFPQAIALASTWDRNLVQRIYTLTAREIRARGAHLVLSPVVDVARDPRWGRIEETYGEDPYLVAELGVAAVLGFQGTELPLADDRVFATLKHMTGHGQPEGGENRAPASISERVLRETFLVPFEQIVKRTNIRYIMPSYNEGDGIQVGENPISTIATRTMPMPTNKLGMADAYKESLLAIADRYAEGELTEDERELLTESNLPALAASLRQSVVLDSTLRQRIREVNLPALIYVGEEDANAQRPLEEEIGAKLPGFFANPIYMELPALTHLEGFARSDLVLPHVIEFVSRR